MSTASERLAETLRGIITNRLANDKLKLPVLPDAAVIALELVRDPDVSLARLADALGRDPVLAIQIVRAANSAALSTGGSIKTLLQAVTRVGNARLKQFIVEACARKLFISRDARISKSMAAVWEHSLGVAVMARDLAALSGSSESDAAYLSGLLHDIGKPIVGGLLLEVERRLGGVTIDSATALAVIQKVHREIGVAVTEAWGMMPEVVIAVRDCGDYDASSRASIVNFVRFANALVKRQGIYETDVDLDDADALILVGRSLLGIDDDVVQSLCGELRDRLRATG